MNNEPMQYCINLFKSLEGTNLRIYKEAMDEDANSVPKSYIIIRAKVSDNPRVFGDGCTNLRVADCDISLISKGVAKTTTCLHNTNKAGIESTLNSAGIRYSSYNLGYNKATKESEHTFSFQVIYG